MSEFLPLVLLFLFGGFAAISALLKSRGRVRAPLSVILTVLEGISGMVLMGASLPMSGSLETASRIAILTAVLVAISSAVHLMKVRGQGRGRVASEGKRLFAAIRYEAAVNPSGIGEEPSEVDDSTRPGNAGDRPGDAGDRLEDAADRPGDAADPPGAADGYPGAPPS